VRFTLSRISKYPLAIQKVPANRGSKNFGLFHFSPPQSAGLSGEYLPLQAGLFDRITAFMLEFLS